MITIGVLALQGSVIEHIRKLELLPNVRPLEVKTSTDLQSVDGIILPGGESTTIAKLLHDFELFELLRLRIEDGLPVWGTCAGMILLAKEIVDEQPHLCVMDIKVRRNAFGSQLDSFSQNTVIPEICLEPMELVFIRAPWIDEVKDNVQVFSTINGHIIVARQENMLATSYHPELTNNLSTHEYFAAMVRGNRC